MMSLSHLSPEPNAVSLEEKQCGERPDLKLELKLEAFPIEFPYDITGPYSSLAYPVYWKHTVLYTPAMGREETVVIVNSRGEIAQHAACQARFKLAVCEDELFGFSWDGLVKYSDEREHGSLAPLEVAWRLEMGSRPHAMCALPCFGKDSWALLADGVATARLVIVKNRKVCADLPLPGHGCLGHIAMWTHDDVKLVVCTVGSTLYFVDVESAEVIVSLYVPDAVWDFRSFLRSAGSDAGPGLWIPELFVLKKTGSEIFLFPSTSIRVSCPQTLRPTNNAYFVGPGSGPRTAARVFFQNNGLFCWEPEHSVWAELMVPNEAWGTWQSSLTQACVVSEQGSCHMLVWNAGMVACVTSCMDKKGCQTIRLVELQGVVIESKDLVRTQFKIFVTPLEQVFALCGEQMWLV